MIFTKNSTFMFSRFVRVFGTEIGNLLRAHGSDGESDSKDVSC